MARRVTLIIKLTNACNMQCRYCFIEPSVFHKTMSLGTMRRIVRAFLDSQHFASVTFVWHGGEPLLRGREFFEQIVAEQAARPTGVEYENAIQTNATRLNDEMMSFLLRNNFRIGLSLDGPIALNDASRVSRSTAQESAHDVTLDAARRLQARGQAAGAIVVVSAANVDHPVEIYEEFRSKKIHMKIIPLMKAGLANSIGIDLGISAEQYGDFLVALFDLWYDELNPVIGIDPFEKHVARVLGIPGAGHDCHFARSCHRSFIGIAPDGDLFPCGMFQGEPAFRYGNIDDLSPELIPLTALFGRIDERERRVLETCSSCDFFDLCYSGCMFHSLKNSNRFEEKDYYCAGYKRYFDHMIRRLHADVNAGVAPQC